jgi:hypothetical protein
VCLLYNAPKFIKFKPYDRRLKKTPKYKDYVRRMLFDEYRLKDKLLNEVNLAVKSLEVKLKDEFSMLVMS